MRQPRVRSVLGAAVLAVGAIGCSPTFNWRETSPEGTGLVTSFPCRPDRHSRNVDVAGRTVKMEMLVCGAGDATYAVSFFDAPDPAGVTTGLQSLRSALLSNVQAGVPRMLPLTVTGMSANPAAARLSVEGRRPDGGVLRLEAAFFAKASRVFQVAVVGPPLTAEGIDPFFDGLRLSD